MTHCVFLSPVSSRNSVLISVLSLDVYRTCNAYSGAMTHEMCARPLSPPPPILMDHTYRAAIEKDLADGVTIITDRYAFSGIAFSAAKVSRQPLSWMR